MDIDQGSKSQPSDLSVELGPQIIFQMTTLFDCDQSYGWDCPDYVSTDRDRVWKWKDLSGESQKNCTG